METNTDNESIEIQRPNINFREISAQNLPTKTPICFILIRRFVFGLIFLICIAIIAVWMILTIDYFDVDENKKEVFFESDRQTNGCNSSLYSCSLTRVKVVFWLNNAFIFMGSILTAISILAFVFVSAMFVLMHTSNRLTLI